MSSTDFKEQFLKNNQPPIFIKLLAMLSLVRWYNVLLVTKGLYLSSIFMLQDHIPKIDVIKDISLHINVVAIAFLIIPGILAAIALFPLTIFAFVFWVFSKFYWKWSK